MAEVVPSNTMSIEEAQKHFHNLTQMLMSPAILLEASRTFDEQKREHDAYVAEAKKQEQYLAGLNKDIESLEREKKDLAAQLAVMNDRYKTLEAGINSMLQSLTAKAKE